MSVQIVTKKTPITIYYKADGTQWLDAPEGTSITSDRVEKGADFEYEYVLVDGKRQLLGTHPKGITD